MTSNRPVILSFRVSGDTRKKINELCLASNAPQSWLISLAVEKFYEENIEGGVADWFKKFLESSPLQLTSNRTYTIVTDEDGKLDEITSPNDYDFITPEDVEAEKKAKIQRTLLSVRVSPETVKQVEKLRKASKAPQSLVIEKAIEKLYQEHLNYQVGEILSNSDIDSLAEANAAGNGRTVTFELDERGKISKITKLEDA